MEKLASAAKLSLVNRSLNQDCSQLLYGAKDEAKVQRLTRSPVVWTAKVMSDETLDRARAAQRKIRLPRRKSRESVNGSGRCLHEKRMAM